MGDFILGSSGTPISSSASIIHARPRRRKGKPCRPRLGTLTAGATASVPIRPAGHGIGMAARGDGPRNRPRGKEKQSTKLKAQEAGWGNASPSMPIPSGPSRLPDRLSGSRLLAMPPLSLDNPRASRLHAAPALLSIRYTCCISVLPCRPRACGHAGIQSLHQPRAGPFVA